MPCKDRVPRAFAPSKEHHRSNSQIDSSTNIYNQRVFGHALQIVTSCSDGRVHRKFSDGDIARREGQVITVKKVCGFSLKNHSTPRGGSGQCSNLIHSCPSMIAFNHKQDCFNQVSINFGSWNDWSNSHKSWNDQLYVISPVTWGTSPTTMVIMTCDSHCDALLSCVW